MGVVAETEPTSAPGRPGIAGAGLALLAISAGVVTAFGLLQLLHRANDPMRRVNRLLDLCYEKISNLESTLGGEASASREIVP